MPALAQRFIETTVVGGFARETAKPATALAVLTLEGSGLGRAWPRGRCRTEQRPKQKQSLVRHHAAASPLRGCVGSQVPKAWRWRSIRS